MTTADEFIRDALRSAPAGKFNELLDDFQKLLGSSSIDNDVLADMKNRHEQETCSSGSSSEVSSHPLAASLKAELEKYQEGLYNSSDKDVAARGEIAPSIDNDANTILVRTYAERVDEKKSRTGFWSAEWTIQTSSETTGTLSGHVNICSFSFEGGNFQLRSTRDFPSISLEDELLAAAIMKQIAAWETEVFLSLMDSCARSSQSLKSIRGILPITHTRLNWNVVAHRTVRTLQESVGK